ncbi:hypothetical protein COEREDRAFT_79914 [Coemansia reversa NRRL 1564]|uniref:Uncharacterized protein n=1 Tax=Coemansia reversa (strain ATCC 12441 / NRRL 1564) TaxID=763665 RepID=A0A2G5BHH6_COERN|nr:hypothetical protein COEREDRAFT_79914 [Coemansia reversa NRRL 1564]|eukprot:PIA18463.1 hypothetical protein COEREDRAFT_79914 [Coemansia reversa NRRL 1564]
MCALIGILLTVGDYVQQKHSFLAIATVSTQRASTFAVVFDRNTRRVDDRHDDACGWRKFVWCCDAVAVLEAANYAGCRK